MVDFHLLLVGREEKPHPSLPLCNFCQLTRATLRDVKLELEKLRDSKKVRKKTPLTHDLQVSCGKIRIFFLVEGCQKRDFSHNLLSFKGNAGVAASSILKLFGFQY